MSPATWKDAKYATGIRHPEHARDIARAVKYLYANAQRYGYSRDKIFIGGYSSGAHLAALLTMDKRFLEAEGLPGDLFSGIIPVAGTYDIQHYYDVLAESDRALADNHVSSVFGQPEAYRDASPTSYIGNLTTPILLISEAYTYRYTKLFEDKLYEANFNSLEVLHVLRLNHGALWKNLSRSDDSIYRALIVDFITRNAVPARENP
jgi:arylformamidase